MTYRDPSRVPLVAGLICVSAFAQSPAFDVASIREVPNSKGRGAVGQPVFEFAAGRFSLQASLMGIIEVAYDVRAHQVSGPSWLDSNAFLILARADPDATQDQLRAMCRSLLAERFGLTLHGDRKEMPVFAIVKVSSGPKLIPVETAAGGDLSLKMKAKPGRIVSTGASLDWLAEALNHPLGRPVLNKTGIEGKFRIVLDWTPDGGEAEAAKAGKPAAKTKAGKESEPTIFTAIQEQLGLKLESQKGMVDVLVIDHAEKHPTEN